ncbi:hypothetical protein Landi51_01555 [Colletotrichum acutatum]
MQGAFPLDVSLELQPPESNLAVSGPEAWCTKLLVGIPMPSLPSSPCHRFALLSMRFAPFAVRTPYCVPDSVLSIDAMANGPYFGIFVPRLMSFPATNLLDPARYQSQKRKEATSQARRRQTRPGRQTLAPFPTPAGIRSTESWDSTTHH